MRLGWHVENAGRVIARGVIDTGSPAAGRSLRELGPASPNLTAANRKKIKPKTGGLYSLDLSPLFARSSSAASQRRFSRVAVPVSFEVGAIQRTVLASVHARGRRAHFRRSYIAPSPRKGGSTTPPASHSTHPCVGLGSPGDE
jgi:hypothetical protein